MKKGKYSSACDDRRATFTPFCCSADRIMGSEAKVFLQKLGERLSVKLGNSIGEVMGWVCTRLTFAVLRESIL